MIRNQAGQIAGATIINASTGGAFSGTVNVFVDGDATGQNAGVANGGVATLQGNSYYTYPITATETNFALVAVTFTGSGAIPVTVQYATVTAQQQQALMATAASGSKSVTDLLTGALNRINVLQSNQPPDPDMLAAAFDRFNDWIDSVCALNRLTIFSITSTSFAIVNGQASYTLGTGGNINVLRPVYIDHVTFTDSSLSPAYERPLVPLTDDAWAAIPIKTLTSPYPTYAYYNPTFTTGAFGTLYLWQIPTSSTLTGNIYAPAAVTRFGSLTDTIALPPGYNRFMRDNLAVELAAEFRENVPVDPSLMKSAAESMSNIKRANIRLQDTTIDSMWLGHSGQRSNIYTGP